MNDIHSLAHAYVVDALDPDEAAEFELHLSTCPECTQEIAALREVAAAMSQHVAAEPPPSLRASILDAIADTPQETSSSGDVATTQEPQPRREPGAVPASVTQIDAASGARDARRHAGSRRPSGWTIGLVAAALVAVLGLGGWAIQSQQDLKDTQRESETIAAQSRQLARVLSADDVQIVRGQYSDGGDGAVVMSESEGAAMLVGRDLPELPDDRVYEAWTIEGDPVPAGTFTPSEGQSVLELPSATFEADIVAVTVEPEGGSESPTTEPIFNVEIPRG